MSATLLSSIIILLLIFFLPVLQDFLQTEDWSSYSDKSKKGWYICLGDRLRVKKKVVSHMLYDSNVFWNHIESFMHKDFRS